MFRVIFKGTPDEIVDAKSWCDNANIEYTTDWMFFENSNMQVIPITKLRPNVIHSVYFAFAHEVDAGTFIFCNGGKCNYVSGQSRFVNNHARARL
jgi:hypothetical protein